mmetsp:Transcript_106149/g.297147  ORF Transcript_106149/g.297147 Transcript_106149/m.297147 type:complete len:283 (+) Transcript_106149:229-1077(+)
MLLRQVLGVSQGLERRHPLLGGARQHAGEEPLDAAVLQRPEGFVLRDVEVLADDAPHDLTPLGRVVQVLEPILRDLLRHVVAPRALALLLDLLLAPGLRHRRGPEVLQHGGHGGQLAQAQPRADEADHEHVVRRPRRAPIFHLRRVAEGRGVEAERLGIAQVLAAQHLVALHARPAEGRDTGAPALHEDAAVVEASVHDAGLLEVPRTAQQRDDHEKERTRGGVRRARRRRIRPQRDGGEDIVDALQQNEGGHGGLPDLQRPNDVRRCTPKRAQVHRHFNLA